MSSCCVKISDNLLVVSAAKRVKVWLSISISGSWAVPKKCLIQALCQSDSAKVVFNDENTQIPLQNQPGFDVTGIMWYKDGAWCDSETDTDNDGLLDYLELMFNTDINNPDTDNDGLSDGDEVNILKTDPTKTDSDNNGINDSEEDADNDGLSNLEERQLGTDPTKVDTDNDGLTDGEEVHTHHTAPLKEDTDGDYLLDGDEITLNLNPLNKYSNDDGVLDCRKDILQTVSQEIEEPEKPEITNVSVSMNTNGNIKNMTTIKNIYNQDVMSSNLEGLVGAPIEIETTSCFDTADIVFEYDESLLKDVNEEDLAVVWYDEENHIYRLQDSKVDPENNKVKATVTHFSKYMLVDKVQWFKNWSKPIDYHNNKTTPLNTVIAIDCSGSMYVNDPFFDYDFVTPTITDTCYRILATQNYIDAKCDEDKIAIVTFNSSAQVQCNLTTSKTEAMNAVKNVYSRGGTNFENIIEMSKQLLCSTNDNHDKSILLISDGEAYIEDRSLESVKSAGITINTVFIDHVFEDTKPTRNPFPNPEPPILNLESISKPTDSLKVSAAVSTNSLQSVEQSDYKYDFMKYIADKTEGEFFVAKTSKELMNFYDYLALTRGINTEDLDSDGLYDVYEREGMQLPNGTTVFTDPNNPDSDYDGLLDGEEILQIVNAMPAQTYNSFNTNNQYEFAQSSLIFRMRSDPHSADSDDDGLLDGSPIMYGRFAVAPKDPYPLDKDPMMDVWQTQIESAEQGNIGTKYRATIMDGLVYSADELFNKLLDTYHLDRNELNHQADAAVVALVNTALSLRKDVVNNKDKLTNVMQTIKSCLGYAWSSDVVAKISADFGAIVLDFHHNDVQSNTYHALPDTWQKAFGYNKLYDDVFDISSDMRIGKCFFNMSSNPNDLDNLYVIWAWRGDYWNLGAGCEVGLYKYSRTVDSNDHFDASPINLPMSLNMYVLENNTISSSFNWYPNADQWWITGFDYTRQSPNPDSLVTTGYIDFSDHIDMYEKIKDSQKLDDNKKLPNAMNLYPYLIFDETNHYVWFMWYS